MPTEKVFLGYVLADFSRRQNAKAYYYRGAAYLMLGNNIRTAEDFEKANELGSEDYKENS